MYKAWVFVYRPDAQYHIRNQLAIADTPEELDLECESAFWELMDDADFDVPFTGLWAYFDGDYKLHEAMNEFDEYVRLRESNPD